MSTINDLLQNRLVAALITILLLLTAAQSYFLFQVYRQLPGNSVYATELKTPEANKKVESPNWQLSPNTATSAPLDPLAAIPTQPFDPNSWNPFKEMEEMQKQVDRMFGQAFGHFNASPQFNEFSQSFSFNPMSDIEENDHEYIVHLDVPGTDSSNIKVTLEDRTLSISGEREEVTQQGNKKQLRNERRLGQFERVLTLPGPVNQKGMKTEYKNGVLTITIPKDETVTQGVMNNV